MSSIKGQVQQRANLLQGTLDMLILRTLHCRPAHGPQTGKHIQQTTNDFLQMQHGSLWSEEVGLLPPGKQPRTVTVSTSITG